MTRNATTIRVRRTDGVRSRIWRATVKLALCAAGEAWTVALVGLRLRLDGSSWCEGTQARVQDPAIWAAVQPPPGGVQPQGLSLDGMAYMRGWYPGDYAAINWMNQHIGGMPVIVEASNGAYAVVRPRLDLYRPARCVLGWSSHEAQQRYRREVVPAPERMSERSRGPTIPNAALELPDAHIMSSYIYLGNARAQLLHDQAGSDAGCVPMSAAAIEQISSHSRTAGMLRAVYSTGRCRDLPGGWLMSELLAGGCSSRRWAWLACR